MRRTRGISTSNNPPPTKANKTLLWGATGEQEWTPALTTGELFIFLRFKRSAFGLRLGKQRKRIVFGC